MEVEALIELLIKELERDEANNMADKGADQRDLIMRLSQYRVKWCEKNSG